MFLLLVALWYKDLGNVILNLQLAAIESLWNNLKGDLSYDRKWSSLKTQPLT